MPAVPHLFVVEDRTGNRIVDTLPFRERRRVMDCLDEVPIAAGDVLADLSRPDGQIIFPVSGVVSLLATSPQRGTIEVATVADEGVVGGVPNLFHQARLPGVQAVCHIAGSALVMNLEDFRAEVAVQGALNRMVVSYSASLMAQFVQNALCGRRHSVEERLARWLLMGLDHSRGAEVSVTHSVLARALGVRRPGVSLAAETLQRAGLIRCGRASIAVLDRDGLESRSCECYRMVRDEIDRFLTRAELERFVGTLSPEVAPPLVMADGRARPEGRRSRR